MRTSPPIVPHEPDRDTYVVLDDFGRIGRAWKTNEAAAHREILIHDLLTGKYSDPVRIVAFNTAEGWSRDVTMDIADEVRRRFVDYHEVSDSVLPFVEANQRR